MTNDTATNQMTANNSLATVIGSNFVPLCFLFGLKIPVLVTATFLSITPIYLTFKSNVLRSNCNFLIALNFFNSSLQLPAALISATVVLSGQIQIRMTTCFPLQIGPYIGATAQWSICFAIALDRLIGLFFPFFYSNFFGKKRLIFVLIASLCYTYTLYKALISYTYSMGMSDKLVICGTTDIYPSQNYIDVLQNLAVNLATASCYIFLWVSLRCKISGESQDECSRRIFRSVSAIMLLEVLGWFTNNLLRLILPFLKLNTLDALYYSHSAAFLLYIALGAQAPVLYIFSKEYREVFEREFKFVGFWRKMYAYCRPSADRTSAAGATTTWATQCQSQTANPSANERR